MSETRQKVEPRRIGRLVEEVLGGLSIQRSKTRVALVAAWEAAVGPSVARQSRVVGLERGTLHVAVESAPLLQHLAQFRKAELLRALRSDPAASAVRDLRLSTGV